MRRRGRQLSLILGLGVLFVLAAHPLAVASTDLWGNVAPALPLGAGGLFGRYPLDHFTLDQHFEAVEASLTGGVHVHGVPPMIAYFLAGVLWVLTSFLANALISLFAFAFSLDLVHGSTATGGAGALGPVAGAIHSIYSNVFGAPWLVLAVTLVGIWAMWRALVQRRYSETAGALALSLIYVVLALFFVSQPARTIGSASKWTNQMSEAFLSISDHGDPSGVNQAKDDAANQLFDLLVFKPWVVLEFGGLEHCVLSGSGGEDSDPISAPVRPLSSNPARDAQLARRLASGTEVTADGKVCVNNANKYARHFLQFGLGTDERDAEYDALDHGDSSKLPEADSERKGYPLGVADKPATDAMEEGGQYQRLLIAIVVFLGELGAFCLLGSLSIGIILAQILLLLLLAFAPVALVAAAIPGRGHAFFKGWLEKIAGYLLRKAAYSLILATLLAVAGALSSATAAMGWLMSFGLQALFFWLVFLHRKNLAESLIGIATGPGAPGRDNTLRLLALYTGARTMRRPFRGLRRSAGSATDAPERMAGGIGPRLGGGKGRKTGPGAPAPRFGTIHSTSGGDAYPDLDYPSAPERQRDTARTDGGNRPAGAASESAAPAGRGAKPQASKLSAEEVPPTGGAKKRMPPGRSERSQPERPARAEDEGESGLSAELREERERRGPTTKRTPPPASPKAQTPPGDDAPAAPPRRRRGWRPGRGR